MAKEGRREKRRGRAPGVPLPNLKKERMRRGFTVRGLAEKAGMNVSTVNAVENGRRGAQGSTLRKLAEALAVETTELVGDALEPEPSIYAPGYYGVSGARKRPGSVEVSPGSDADPEFTRLLEGWLADDSADDERVWPELRRMLDEDRPSHRRLFER